MSVSSLALLVIALTWQSSVAQSASPPAQEAAPPAAAQATRPTDAGESVMVIPLKHAEAGDTCRAISRACSRPSGRGRSLAVAADYTANSVILSGPQEAIDQAMTLIRTLDIEGARGRETHFIKLQTAQATEVATLVRCILEQTYPSRDKDELPGLLSDPRTNTVIVTGSAKEHQLIKELLKALDSEMPSPPMPEQRSAARFELAVYETPVPRDRLAAIDVAKLTERAQTCQSLQDTLAELGKTKVLYRAEEIVALSSGTKLVLGSNVPFVRGIQVTESGQRTSQIEYEKVGCRADLSGFWNDAKRETGEVTADIEMSTLAESSINIGNDILAPVFRDIKQPFAGAVTSGRPIVLLTVDAGGGGDTAVAYVTRMVFHRQP